MRPLNSSVLTPTGWVEIRTIEKGDYVCSPTSGLPVKVIDTVYNNYKEIYTITYEDGISCECSLDQLFRIKILSKWYTLDLKSVIKHLEASDVLETIRSNKVEFKKREYDTHPFILGSMISKGIKLGTHNGSGLPHEYLYNTSSIREDLLLGLRLLDKENRFYSYLDPYDFVSTSERLRLDFVELCNSLGKCVVDFDQDSFKDSHNSKGTRGRNDKYVWVKYRATRQLIKVEYKGHNSVKSILVDSEDHLYITNNYIVMYN